MLDQEQSPVASSTTFLSWIARPFLDDEAGVRLKNFRLDQEDAWQARRTTISWRGGVSSDDEAAAVLAAFLLDQEDAAPSARDRRQSVVWASVPFLDDEALGGKYFPIDQDDAFLAARTTTSWTPRPFRDDEASTRLGYFRLDDEPAFIPARQAVCWRAVVFSDEAASLYAPPDDETGTPTSRSRVAWTPVVFAADEELQGLMLDDEAGFAMPARALVVFAALSLPDDEPLPPALRPGVGAVIIDTIYFR